MGDKRATAVWEALPAPLGTQGKDVTATSQVEGPAKREKEENLLSLSRNRRRPRDEPCRLRSPFPTPAAWRVRGDLAVAPQASRAPVSSAARAGKDRLPGPRRPGRETSLPAASSASPRHGRQRPPQEPRGPSQPGAARAAPKPLGPQSELPRGGLQAAAGEGRRRRPPRLRETSRQAPPPRGLPAPRLTVRRPGQAGRAGGARVPARRLRLAGPPQPQWLPCPSQAAPGQTG